MKWIYQQHYETINFKRNTDFIKQVEIIYGKFHKKTQSQ